MQLTFGIIARQNLDHQRKKEVPVWKRLPSLS